MQSVTEAFKSASVAITRFPLAKLFVSWTRAFFSGADYFTIGVSSIGGSDPIKGNNDAITESDKYEYFDESDYLMSIEMDRYLDEPIFSIARGTLDVVLDNNSDRFTPGVDAEIGADIKSKRPLRASLGFKYNGISNLISQMIALIDEAPKVDKANRTVTLHAIDYTDALWDYSVERTSLYTTKRTDELLDILLQDAGLNTDQYDLDTGFITIPFAFFNKGDKLGNIITKLCQAEQGMFFIDEDGIFKFWNREHLANSPHDTSQVTITDEMVISEENPNIDTIVNVVEVTAKPRAVVGTDESIFDLPDTREILAGQTVEVWANYDNPIYSLVTPTGGVGASSYYTANTASDGSGTDKTAQVDLVITNFSTSSKLEFTNNDAGTVHLTELIIFGKPAKVTQELYLRKTDDTSIADYEEHPVTIENDYIQNNATAADIANSIIANRKDPAGYLKIKIIALPHLQLGDLITRNSTEYFVIRIKTKFTPQDGFIQELTLVNRTIAT